MTRGAIAHLAPTLQLALLAGLAIAGDGPTEGWVAAPVRAPGVRYATFRSAAAKVETSYQIYLPPHYDAEPARRFPVVYWLHGSGGGAQGIAPVSAQFDGAIRSGRLPPLLVVFPNGLADSMWCDSKDGRVPMETVFIRELLPHIDAVYRTIPDRGGRILEGFSMGGYGAGRLGLKHPELFGAVSMLGAGPLQESEFDPERTPRGDPREARALLAKTWGGDQAYFRAQSPWAQARAYAAGARPPLRLRLVAGALEEGLANNRKFDAHLTALGVAHQFIVLPGIGHQPVKYFKMLGDENWAFHRAALSAASG